MKYVCIKLKSSDELEGLGCEQIEEEAEYDALNDETFGTEALGTFIYFV